MSSEFGNQLLAQSSQQAATHLMTLCAMVRVANDSVNQLQAVLDTHDSSSSAVDILPLQQRVGALTSTLAKFTPIFEEVQNETTALVDTAAKALSSSSTQSALPEASVPAVSPSGIGFGLTTLGSHALGVSHGLQVGGLAGLMSGQGAGSSGLGSFQQLSDPGLVGAGSHPAGVSSTSMFGLSNFSTLAGAGSAGLEGLGLQGLGAQGVPNGAGATASGAASVASTIAGGGDDGYAEGSGSAAKRRRTHTHYVCPYCPPKDGSARDMQGRKNVRIHFHSKQTGHRDRFIRENIALIRNLLNLGPTAVPAVMFADVEICLGCKNDPHVPPHDGCMNSLVGFLYQAVGPAAAGAMGGLPASFGSSSAAAPGVVAGLSGLALPVIGAPEASAAAAGAAGL